MRQGCGSSSAPRMTKAPIDLESHFRWHGEGVRRRADHRHHHPQNRPWARSDPQRARPVWQQDGHPQAWRAVWAFSRKRAVRDRATLTKQEERARAVIASQKAARSPRFVKTSRGQRHLDVAGIDRARALAGLKGYVTNIDAATMSAPAVIAAYHDHGASKRRFGCPKPTSPPVPCSPAPETPSKPTSPSSSPPSRSPEASKPEPAWRCASDSSTTPAALGDHRHQRHRANLPTEIGPEQQRHHRRHQRHRNWALRQMSQLRWSAHRCGDRVEGFR